MNDFSSCNEYWGRVQYSETDNSFINARIKIVLNTRMHTMDHILPRFMHTIEEHSGIFCLQQNSLYKHFKKIIHFFSMTYTSTHVLIKNIFNSL